MSDRFKTPASFYKADVDFGTFSVTLSAKRGCNAIRIDLADDHKENALAFWADDDPLDPEKAQKLAEALLKAAAFSKKNPKRKGGE
mgnify:CR=1 FL=1